MSLIDAVANNNAALSSSKSASKSVEESFLDFVKKSPAERIRDQLLKELGLTEEQLAAMSPAQQRAIEEKITQRLKEKMAEAMGKKVG